jgi:hypothetical protein
MDKKEVTLKRTMEALRLIYRNQGKECSEEELRFLASRRTLRDYIPQIIIIIAGVIFLFWRFW